MPEQAAAFCRCVVRRVDAFLDITTGFSKHFTHFPRHLAGDFFFVLYE